MADSRFASRVPFHPDLKVVAKKRFTLLGVEYQAGDSVAKWADATPQQRQKIYEARLVEADPDAMVEALAQGMAEHGEARDPNAPTRRAMAERIAELEAALAAANEEIARLKGTAINPASAPPEGAEGPQSPGAPTGTPDSGGGQSAQSEAPAPADQVSKEPLAEYPAGAVPKHTGFGKWFIVDAEGKKLSGPHTKEVAHTTLKLDVPVE